jgi:predicted DNA-binding antitoxin AbrB/MazE fold protein
MDRSDGELLQWTAGGPTEVVRIVEAIYEGGVLRPLADPGLADHQRVVLEIRPQADTETASTLRAWRKVYEGLSEKDVADVETIALDRSHFFRSEP